jgi:hypothetical protein
MVVMNNGIVYNGIAVLLCCVLSCDESFNPSAAFEPKMVVYSILTTDSDTQYVRVYSTYNPPDNDPTKNQNETSVTDAQVTVSGEGGSTFTFQPITIQRPDLSRYMSDIRAYYAYPFRPQRGKNYSLTVSSQLYGVATATLTVPSPGLIIAQNQLVLKDPWNVPVDIVLSIQLSAVAKGYLIRFYVDYEMSGSTGWRAARIEVPIAIRRMASTGQVIEYVFPKIKRSRIPATSRDYFLEQFVFLRDAYQETIKAILSSASGIRFKQAVFHLIQIDEPLYNYYFVANAFKDRSSIRVDEPDYTNISGGVGVFSSVTTDSLVYLLPEVIEPY